MYVKALPPRAVIDDLADNEGAVEAFEAATAVPLGGLGDDEEEVEGHAPQSPGAGQGRGVRVAFNQLPNCLAAAPALFAAPPRPRFACVPPTPTVTVTAARSVLPNAGAGRQAFGG